ncbi:unnamed protein product [Pedinophyceae sp. YPF-701]|nr:unnamed protein product [Pedinophyceae sp. YPF-701]
MSLLRAAVRQLRSRTLPPAAVSDAWNQARCFANGTELTVRDALNSALDEEMARDEKVFIMGEEVAEYQGAYKVTRGLLQKYGAKRVRDTPITEMGFTGLAVGASQAGLKPIVEFMTFNFSLQALDQVINSCAKAHYMSAGDLTNSIVFRGPNGVAPGVAAQHSQCFAAWLSSIPGLKVVAVYDCEDARGLLKAAVRDPDPVVVLESETMYGEKFPVSDAAMDKDFVLPIGKAHVVREGSDVTLVSFGKSMRTILNAADELAKEGISAEVINLRSIRPLDGETITASIQKTGRVVTVEEGYPQCGIGAEISTMACEYAFDYLDAPPERLTSIDCPTPYATPLEEAYVPRPADVVRVVRKMFGQ